MLRWLAQRPDFQRSQQARALGGEMTPPKMGDDLGQDDVTYDCNDPQCRKRIAALERELNEANNRADDLRRSLDDQSAAVFDRDRLQAEVERLTLDYLGMNDQFKFTARANVDLAQELAVQRSENELLRRLVDQQCVTGECEQVEAENKRLQAEVERLRSALKKYGRHVDMPGALNRARCLGGMSCVCGLDEALAADRDAELLKQMGPQKNDRKGWGEPIGKRLHSDPNEHGPRCAAHYMGSDGKQYPCNCDRQEGEDA